MYFCNICSFCMAYYRLTLYFVSFVSESQFYACIPAVQSCSTTAARNQSGYILLREYNRTFNEYPIMHYSGITIHTQSMIAWKIWLSISGNSSEELHCGNAVNMPYCALAIVKSSYPQTK